MSYHRRDLMTNSFKNRYVIPDDPELARCFNYFDSSKNGHVSKHELAIAQYFPTAAYNNFVPANVTTFNEFRYFKGFTNKIKGTFAQSGGFNNWTSLEEICLPPKAIFAIDDYANRASWFKVKKLNITNLETLFKLYTRNSVGNNVMFTINTKLYNFYTKERIRDLVIPKSVIGIPPNTFRNCTCLDSITFHKDIKDVGSFVINLMSTTAEINQKQLENGYIEGTSNYSCQAPANDVFTNASLENVFVEDPISYITINFGSNSNPIKLTGYIRDNVNNEIINSITLNEDITIGMRALDSYSIEINIHNANHIKTFSSYCVYNAKVVFDKIKPNILKTNSFNTYKYKTFLNYDGTIEEWLAVTKESNWHASSSLLYIQCTDGKAGLDDTTETGNTYNE